jgi:hypothetical protein
MPEFEAEQESRLWRWMLVIVVLALAVWAFAELAGTERPDEQALTDPAAVEATGEMPADVSQESATPVTGAAFQTWVRDSAETHERLDAPDYVAVGLHRLLSALRGLASRPGDNELELRATALASATDALVSAGATDVAAFRYLLLNSADLAADALPVGAGATAEPRARAGSHAIEQNLRAARQAAEALNADTPLERQRHRVFNYFDHMSEAIVRAADLPVEPPAARP